MSREHRAGPHPRPLCPQGSDTGGGSPSPQPAVLGRHFLTLQLWFLCASHNPLRTWWRLSGNAPELLLHVIQGGLCSQNLRALPLNSQVQNPCSPSLQLVSQPQVLRWVSFATVAARCRQRPGWTPHVSSRAEGSFSQVKSVLIPWVKLGPGTNRHTMSSPHLSRTCLSE